MSTNTHFEFYKNGIDRSNKVLLPDESCFRTVNQTDQLIAIAEEIDIPVPDTRILTPDQELDRIDPPESYPRIVKIGNDEGLYLEPSQRYALVESESEFYVAIRELIDHGKPILDQAYIPGGGVGYSGLYIQGEHCMGLGHQRIREYPPGGGPSTDCKRIFDDEIQRCARRLMREVNWSGPSMVEFRRHRESGDPYLMEVNPRYWGSLPLARSCGMNIPHTQFQIMGTGENREMDSGQSNGRVKFLLLDVASVLTGLWGGQEEISSVAKWAYDLLKGSYDFGIWDSKDPRPFVRYVISRFIQFTPGLPSP